MRGHPIHVRHPMTRATLVAVLCCVALCSMFAVFATRARAGDGINITIPAVDESSFPRLAITLSAEQAGLPVAANSGIAVQVTEDGQPLTVDSVVAASDTSLPLALVFAIDTSGSMAGGTLTSVQQSVRALIASLAPQDAAAVIGFADKVTVAQPLTTDRAALTTAVAGLQVGGNTALYDAVAQSSAIATGSGIARRAIILLTDGEDFGSVSATTRDSSLNAVAAGGTLVYAIGVGSQVDASYLQAVAQRSGGKFFASPDAAGVAAIYASLEQLLRSQIVVTVQSKAAAGSGDHTLAVRLQQGSANASADRTYTSPAASAAIQPSSAITPRPKVTSGQVAAAHSGRTSLSLVFAAGGLAAVLVGGLIIAIAWRRRRPRNLPWTLPLAELDSTPLPAASAFADVQRANGHNPFIVEATGLAAHAPLGSLPVTIGSAPGCELQLPASPDVAPEHARIWVRDGRPMLHHLAMGYVTSLNGAPADWASVSANDRIGIGPHTLRCVAAPSPSEASLEVMHS